MTWYILRHAEKERGDFHNPQLRHQDQPVSAKGRQDAQKLVPVFTDKSIETVYVSAYQRTWQTASCVAEHLKLTPVVDARLNEIDNGLVDEMTEHEFEQAYPEVWKAYMAQTADFRFPGGESGADVQGRVKDFFDEKLLQHRDGNILIVSHDGLIRQMMCHVLGLPVYHRGDFRVNLCGMTEIRYQEEVGRWELLRFNQTIL
jgi:broad specificity phosphatase PhoE